MNKKISNICIHSIMMTTSLVFVFPLYFMLVSITNSNNDIMRGRLLPGTYIFKNFYTALTTTDMALGLFNSFKVSLSILVLTLIISSMAAFGFQFYRSKLRDKIFSILMLSMMIPGTALLIPTFRIAANLGITDKLIGIILPGSLSVLFVFLFRQNLKSFPYSIIEAARIDGAKEFHIFFKIVVPMMKPVYATAAIMSLTQTWSSLLWPLIISQSNASQTLPVILSGIETQMTDGIDYGVLMVGSFLSIIPILLLFLKMQRHFVNGLSGGVKN